MPIIGAATPHSDVFAELLTASNVFYLSVRLPSAQKRAHRASWSCAQWRQTCMWHPGLRLEPALIACMAPSWAQAAQG